LIKYTCILTAAAAAAASQVLSDVMMSCNRLLDEMTLPQPPALPGQLQLSPAAAAAVAQYGTSINSTPPPLPPAAAVASGFGDPSISSQQHQQQGRVYQHHHHQQQQQQQQRWQTPGSLNLGRSQTWAPSSSKIHISINSSSSGSHGHTVSKIVQHRPASLGRAGSAAAAMLPPLPQSYNQQQQQQQQTPLLAYGLQQQRPAGYAAGGHAVAPVLRYNDGVPRDEMYPTLQPAAAAGRVVESGSVAGAAFAASPAEPGGSSAAGFLQQQEQQQHWQPDHQKPRVAVDHHANAAPLAGDPIAATAAPQHGMVPQQQSSQGDIMPPPPPQLLPPPAAAAAAAAPGFLQHEQQQQQQQQQPSSLLSTPGSLAGRRAFSLPTQPNLQQQQQQRQQQQLAPPSHNLATPVAGSLPPQAWAPAAAAAATAGAAIVAVAGSPTTPLSPLYIGVQPHLTTTAHVGQLTHAAHLQSSMKPRVRRKSSSRAHSRKNSQLTAGDAADSDTPPGEQLIQALEMHMVSGGVDQAVLQEQERLRRLVEQHNRRVAAMQPQQQQQ
jgi:hypothetical protein